MHRQLVPERSDRRPAKPLKLSGVAFVVTLVMLALGALAIWMASRLTA